MTRSGETRDAAVRPRLRLLKLYYLLGASMLMAVALLSLIPAPGVGVNDKLSHLLTYFVLAGWFAVLATNRRLLGSSIAGLLLFGMLIELLQALSAYRQAEWADLAANTAGILLGALLYFTPLPRLLGLLDRGLARLLRYPS